MNAHTLNLDLKTNEKKIVLDLLKRYIPHLGVWAYGSRARWNARPDSDLDLVAFANDTDKRAIADLKEAFEESDLPFKVDLFVWAKVPEHFHTTIQKEKVVVQEMLRCTQHDTPPPVVWAVHEPPLHPAPTNGTMQASPTPTDTPEVWTHTTLDGWTQEKLEKYVKVQGGFAFKSGDFKNIGVPVVKIKNVKHRYIDTSETDFVSSDIALAAQNFYLDTGDVLISMTGSGPNAPASIVGRIARYTDKSRKYLINQRVGRFIIKKPNNLDKRFLFFLLSQKDVQKNLVSVSTGSANQANIGSTQIEQLDFLFPPLPEQEAIAEVLGVLDDKIELNRRMNDTLEAIAKALFKSWFIDFDPVHRNIARSRHSECNEESPTGGRGILRSAQDDNVTQDDEAFTAFDHLFPASFEDSPLGPIPSGWSVGTVGEEFILQMGQSPPGNTYNEIAEGLPFYQGRTDFGFRYPSPRIYCNAPTRIAEKGDTLVSVRAPVGDVNMAVEKSCIGRGVASIRHKTDSTSYTYYSLLSLQTIFKSFDSEGTVFGSINKNDFEKISIITPPQNLILSFESLTRFLDDKIYVASIQAQTLAAVREALLPRLMSGRLRVGDLASGAGA